MLPPASSDAFLCFYVSLFISIGAEPQLFLTARKCFFVLDCESIYSVTPDLTIFEVMTHFLFGFIT